MAAKEKKSVPLEKATKGVGSLFNAQNLEPGDSFEFTADYHCNKAKFIGYYIQENYSFPSLLVGEILEPAHFKYVGCVTSLITEIKNNNITFSIKFIATHLGLKLDKLEPIIPKPTILYKDVLKR